LCSREVRVLVSILVREKKKMSQEPIVVDINDPESVYRAAMAGVTDVVWELTDDEHRVDDEALSALHDIIKRNEIRREAFGE
jgi:hypothetical protein